MIRKWWGQCFPNHPHKGVQIGPGRIVLMGRQLLLYLPQAQQPRIWRLPLKLSQPMEFTLRPLEALGQPGWCLLYLNPLQPQNGFELARFIHESDGREILEALAQILWNASDLGQMLQRLPVPKTALPAVMPVRPRGMPAWLKTILILLVIFILASSLVGTIGRIVAGALVDKAMQQNGLAASDDNTIPTGIPVDANEILAAPAK